MPNATRQTPYPSARAVEDPKSTLSVAHTVCMTTIPLDAPDAIREGVADLDAHGLRAYISAASAVDVERYPFAVLRFARAVEIVEQTRADWVDHGKPILSTHINGALVAHPLVRLIRDLETDAAAAGRACFLDPSSAEKRAPGGQMGRTWAKDRRLVSRGAIDLPPVITWRDPPPEIELRD